MMVIRTGMSERIPFISCDIEFTLSPSPHTHSHTYTQVVHIVAALVLYWTLSIRRGLATSGRGYSPG